jgi:hypothetical protein
MNVWHLDIFIRGSKAKLAVYDAANDRFEVVEINSTRRCAIISGLRQIVLRLGRPDEIHTDRARFWAGLPAALGSDHRYCSMGAQTRRSLLERRFRAEDRA